DGRRQARRAGSHEHRVPRHRRSGGTAPRGHALSQRPRRESDDRLDRHDAAADRGSGLEEMTITRRHRNERIVAATAVVLLIIGLIAFIRWNKAEEDALHRDMRYIPKKETI